MKLEEKIVEKLKKVSRECPNCGSKNLFVVPDVLYLGHEKGVVDLACTTCHDCGFQSIFNIQFLEKVED